MPSKSTNKPSAKRLVLSLLSAPSLPSVSITLLQRWGELFDIDAASMRVTVGRLAKQGLLSPVSRGHYRIGPRGSVLAAAASGWRDAESTVGDWRGDWLLVHVAHLGRTNRSALRNREQAFRLGGFAELAGGLWCRPANLRPEPADIRQRLLSLGLEPGAILSRAIDMPGVEQRDLFALWPRASLEGDYRRHLRTMQASRERLHRLPLAAAARETLLVGEAVIRQINADPLLPAQMMDTTLRSQMIAQMIRYDELGRSVWAAFIASGTER